MLQSRNSSCSLCKHRSLIPGRRFDCDPHPPPPFQPVFQVFLWVTWGVGGQASHSLDGGRTPFMVMPPSRFNICDNKSRLKRWLFNLLAVSVCGWNGDWYNERFWCCSGEKWVPILLSGWEGSLKTLFKVHDRFPDKVLIIKFLLRNRYGSLLRRRSFQISTANPRPIWVCFWPFSAS